MADQDFNKIFFLIAMCLYIQLDVVLLQTPPGSGGQNPPGSGGQNPPGSGGIKTYFEMNTQGDLAVRMQYAGDTVLRIDVYYDAQSDSTTNFFGSEITPELLKNANGCPGVQFVFNPCSALKDNTPNDADMIQVCVADALPKKGDPLPFAQFIICYSGGKQKDDCLTQINVDKNKVNDCIAQKAGASDCSLCHDNFTVAKGGKAEQFKDIKPIEDFKGALCQTLSTGTLKCPSVCGNT